MTGTRTINYYAEDLVDNLGATLVAFMTGVRSRQMPHRWAREGVEPNEAARARLLVAHQVWFDISTSDGPDVARNWFIGANPWLGEQTPAERIRNGDAANVLGACNGFLTDQYGV